MKFTQSQIHNKIVPDQKFVVNYKNYAPKGISAKHYRRLIEFASIQFHE